MPPGSSTGRSRAKATAWQESEQGAWITSEAARSSRGGRIPEHEERGDRGARPKSGITGLTTSKAANSRKALMRLPTDIFAILSRIRIQTILTSSRSTAESAQLRLGEHQSCI